MARADETKIKTFNLVFCFLESLLARLKQQNVEYPVEYLAKELGTTKVNISKILNADGDFNIKSMVALANAAGLEIEITLKDQKTREPYNYIQIATVEVDEKEMN